MKNIFLFVFLFGCGGSDSDRFNQLFSGELEIIDLTYTVDSLMPYWPNKSSKNPFEYEAMASHPSGLTIIGKYATPEHNGTHLDAPIHFADEQATVDVLPPNDFFAPLVVIDVREKCSLNPDYGLTKKDLLDWEDRHGKIPDRSVVIMYTGWGKKAQNMIEYQNIDKEGVMHFPGFTVESNNFLVEERSILAIGIDNLSVDPGNAAGFPAHLVTNGAGKYHLENVSNVHLLPESGAFIVVAPIKLGKGSGGQVRLFAIIPES